MISLLIFDSCNTDILAGRSHARRLDIVLVQDGLVTRQRQLIFLQKRLPRCNLGTPPANPDLAFPVWLLTYFDRQMGEVTGHNPETPFRMPPNTLQVFTLTHKDL